MSTAHDYIKTKGYSISDDDWAHHVSGTRKPGEGKTVSFDIPLQKGGVATNKYAHIQVYNRGDAILKNYEVNVYVDSGKPTKKSEEGLIMYATILKDSAASKKAWASRKRGKSGLTAKERDQAGKDLVKQVRQAERESAAASSASPGRKAAVSMLTPLIGKSNLKHLNWDDDNYATSVMRGSIANSMAKNAKEKGWTVTQSAATTDDGTPRKMTVSTHEGLKMTMEVNREYDGYSAVDITVTGAKKARKSALATDLGMR
jgi:hypothetical protein